MGNTVDQKESVKEIFSHNDLNYSELDNLAKKEAIDSNFDYIFELPDINVACIFGDYNKVKYLLSKNVCINKKDESGYTVLYHVMNYYGITHNNLKIFKLLLDNGAYINIKNFCNEPLLHQLYSLSFWYDRKFDMRKILEILLDYDVEIDTVDENGNTILMEAISCQDDDLLKFLLTKKVNLKLKNIRNFTAIDFVDKINDVDKKKSFKFMLQNYKYIDADFKKYQYFDIDILI